VKTTISEYLLYLLILIICIPAFVFYDFSNRKGDITWITGLTVWLIALIYSIIWYKEARLAKEEASEASRQVKGRIYNINRARHIEAFVNDYQSPSDYNTFEEATSAANILINDLDENMFEDITVDYEWNQISIFKCIRTILDKVVVKMNWETEDVFEYSNYRYNRNKITWHLTRLKSSLVNNI